MQQSKVTLGASKASQLTQLQQDITSLTHDIKFLESQLKKCEASKTNSFYWHGKVYTVYGASRILTSLHNDLNEATLEKVKHYSNHSTL